MYGTSVSNPSPLRECGVLKSECVLELEDGQMNCEMLASGCDVADTPMNSRQLWLLE